MTTTPSYTNTVKAGENLSTIASNAGLTQAQFAALNPHLAATGANSYQGLNNLVQVGTGYNLGAPKAGPVTPPAGTPPATPTIGDIYNAPGPQEDPSVSAARKAYEDYINNQANGNSSVDENKIRQDTLAKYQAEIDAVNSLFADKLNRAKIAGQGRLGSNTAIQSRRGLIGSDFGAAETNGVNQGNETIYAGIDTEKRAAIDSILNQSEAAATAAIAAKNKAIGEGLDAHLKFLNDSVTRKATNAKNAATYIYNQKLSPKDLTPDELSKTATNYGVTPDDIKQAFIDVKKKADQDAADKATKAAKDTSFNLSPGQKRYVQNKDGTYTEVANNPKVITPGGGGGGTGTYRSGKAVFSPDQLSQVSAELESSKTLFGGDGKYVNPEIYLQAYEAWTDPAVGGLGKDFIAKYPPAKYVNPANDTLPSYLRTTKAKVSGRSK